jgi:hypothetical protein
VTPRRPAHPLATFVSLDHELDAHGVRVLRPNGPKFHDDASEIKAFGLRFVQQQHSPHDKLGVTDG